MDREQIKKRIEELKEENNERECDSGYLIRLNEERIEFLEKLLDALYAQGNKI